MNFWVCYLNEWGNRAAARNLDPDYAQRISASPQFGVGVIRIKFGGCDPLSCACANTGRNKMLTLSKRIVLVMKREEHNIRAYVVMGAARKVKNLFETGQINGMRSKGLAST